MKPFVSPGLWYFPPEGPDRAVSGELRFGAAGLVLKLFGSYREGWFPEPQTYRAIHGVVGDSPLGRFITLIDSATQSQTINDLGMGVETIESRAALIGNRPVADEPVPFKKLRLVYSHLVDWLGDPPREATRRPTKLPVEHQPPTEPASLPVSIGDTELTLNWGWKISSRRHAVSFVKTASIDIASPADLTYDRLIPSEVEMIRNLIGFATDSAAGIESIEYFSEGSADHCLERTSVVLGRPRRRAAKKKNQTLDKSLFTFESCQNLGLNILKSWIDFSRTNPRFCDALFRLTNVGSIDSSERLAGVLKAFSLLPSEGDPSSEAVGRLAAEIAAAVDRLFSAPERDLVSLCTPSAQALRAPLRLVHLLQTHTDIMRHLVQDPNQFVREVLTALAGPRPGGGSAIPSGPAFAAEKIRILIIAVVLSRLGFDTTDAYRSIENMRLFRYLRMQ